MCIFNICIINNMKKLIILMSIFSVLTSGCSIINEAKNIESNKIQNDNLEEVKGLSPIDKELKRCLEKNDTTVGMNKCVYQSMNSWNKEIEKYLDLIGQVVSEEDYNKILESQKLWEVFKESEFEIISFIMEKQGTMFQNSTIGMKGALIRQRALNLKELYDTLTYKN